MLDDLAEDDPLHNKSAHQTIAMVDKGFAFMKDMDYKATRVVKIRIRAYSEIMIPSGFFSNTNTPGH